ncbi:MAG TPA: sigma-70 family RNA polymerase sigma factor [Thermoanaerobaculia bacterium]|nr:sigma-70 family RNA polymerase sigma factor [Thermoanaerobaculia bacterium]
MRTSLASSLTLFLRARAGDVAAVSQLFRRLLPDVRRWARGRLPRWARQRVDTDDVVQEAFVALQRRLPELQPRGREALSAYLRMSIQNRIRDEIRRAGRVEVGWDARAAEKGDPRTSPADDAVRSEEEARYRAALRRLSPADQELVVGRLELDLTYEQLAMATQRPSADAARVAVRRAVLRLAGEIADA